MARTVNFNIKKPDGTAWVGVYLYFALSPDSYTATETYPSYTIRSSATDSNGDGSVELWQDETGTIEATYEVTLPSGETFTINVPAGSSAIELSELRGASVPSVIAASTYRLSYFGTLADAVAGIGTADAGLVIDMTETLTASVTVPSNITLIWLNAGNVLDVDSYTLTINGPISAGLYRIFNVDGGGSIALASGQVEYVYPQWWGALADGSTDDYDALVACDLTANAAGPTIVLKLVGEYAVETVWIPTHDNLDFIAGAILAGDDIVAVRFTANASIVTDGASVDVGVASGVTHTGNLCEIQARTAVDGTFTVDGAGAHGIFFEQKAGDNLDFVSGWYKAINCDGDGIRVENTSGGAIQMGGWRVQFEATANDYGVRLLDGDGGSFVIASIDNVTSNLSYS